MPVTPDLLIAAVGCTPERAALFAPWLAQACAHYRIDTAQRLPAFLAETGHESGSLQWVREIATGQAYEGRRDLGNTQTGDGPRYRGRGLIQITGRDNYRATADRLQAVGAPDFEHFPEALEEPEWAAWSAADWWAAHGCNALADAGEFDRISKTINRGNPDAKLPANGNEDRLRRWERAKSALAAKEQSTPEPAEAPQATTPPPEPGKAPSGAPVEPQVAFHQPTEDDLQSGRAFTTQPETPMALQAFVIPAALELAKLIPRIGGLFASGSEVSQRNLKLAEMVVDTIVPAVGAANAQDAVERVKADPQALKQASQAIDENWFRFEDVREKSVAAAREMYATRDRIVLANMVFHEVLALVIVCMTAAGMSAAFIGGDLSQSTKDNIVMLGLVGGFIGIKEFFFGGSRGSDTKTAIMERRQ